MMSSKSAGTSAVEEACVPISASISRSTSTSTDAAALLCVSAYPEEDCSFFLEEDVIIRAEEDDFSSVLPFDEASDDSTEE